MHDAHMMHESGRLIPTSHSVGDAVDEKGAIDGVF